MTNGEALEILNRDDKKMRRGLFCINDFIAIEKCKEVLASAPEWIPVSERLPERFEVVIVSVKTDTYEAVTTDYIGLHNLEHYWDKHFDDEVIAWMPLPEPYKEADK